MTESQKTTHEGATHEEAKPENSKDTRALEQTYLARGLAVRVAELRAALATLEAISLTMFAPADAVAVTALVRLQDDDGSEMLVLLAPCGGGARLFANGVTARVVTIESPLGSALLRKFVGDVATLVRPGGNRELEITELI